MISRSSYMLPTAHLVAFMVQIKLSGYRKKLFVLPSNFLWASVFRIYKTYRKSKLKQKAGLCNHYCIHCNRIIVYICFLERGSVAYSKYISKLIRSDDIKDNSSYDGLVITINDLAWSIVFLMSTLTSLTTLLSFLSAGFRPSGFSFLG